MTDTNDILKVAEQNGTEIVFGSYPKNKSMSVMTEDGETYIALHKRFRTQADKRVHLAHEVGHCVRGAFYPPYTPLAQRGKYERQADEWAIERLVPRQDFVRACKHGARYPWEIAEEFNITPQFAEKAMKYYLGRE